MNRRYRIWSAKPVQRGVAILIVFLIPSGPVWAQEDLPRNEFEAESSESYIPVDLNDAIRHLQEILPPEDIEFLKTAEEEDHAGLHFGFGMGLRNGWGLWGDSRLAAWFNTVGIFHPDDMSGIIIESLVRDLRSEPIELEAQIAKYQEYWAEVEEYEKQERLEEVEREKRRKTARLSWEWTTEPGTEVIVPRQPDWQDVWGLYQYDAGFLVVTKGFRRSYKSVWHDGVYFLDSPNGQLERVEISGCNLQHDVIVQEELATWLCQSYKGQWTLVTTSPGDPDVRRDIELAGEHDWLRLGVGESGLLLVGADRIYREIDDGWKEIYRSGVAVREYNLFDQDDDFREQDQPDPFLPHRSAAPVEHRGYVYFLVENSGNETDLYRLDLDDKDGDLENAQQFISRDYFGNWAFRVSDINVSDTGELWIASHGLGVLFSVEPDGEVGVASIHNNISFSGPIDKLKKPSDWRENLPTGAILHDKGGMILAGVDGIARVNDGRVSPIVRFIYPDGMDRVPYISLPQYDYHVKPQRLGMFEDGSFVIGDLYDGVYILVNKEGGYRFRIPAVAQTTLEMGYSSDDR